jgi:gliding motility-associated lipoprotein GldD
MNLEFPSFGGTLYLSYKKVDNNLVQYFEDTRSFVTKHISKADDITPKTLAFPDNRVWGIYYTIEGIGVASTCQFCLTDSTNHFIRGALYFNKRPNNDSLAPVLEFINKDIDQLISSFKWKD